MTILSTVPQPSNPKPKTVMMSPQPQIGQMGQLPDTKNTKKYPDLLTLGILEGLLDQFINAIVQALLCSDLDPEYPTVKCDGKLLKEHCNILLGAESNTPPIPNKFIFWSSWC
jgi:hypothetical protein